MLSELKQDLISAFDADDFQLKLRELKRANCSDAAAMRDTAMVAQRIVLRKHGFPESFAGVAEMVAALSSNLMVDEKLSHEKAAVKARALAIGLESSETSGWSWRKPASSPQTNKGHCHRAQQVAQLQKDLIDAFGAKDFQSTLKALGTETHADFDEFLAAKRDAAMVAQKAVLRKYGFPESLAGVTEMMKALTIHFMILKDLDQKAASIKAKGLILGMESSQISGWRWPEFTTDRRAESETHGKYAAEPEKMPLGAFTWNQFKWSVCRGAAASTVDTLPGHDIDDNDAASTSSQSSEDYALSN